MKQKTVPISWKEANAQAAKLISQIQKNREDWRLPSEQRSKDKPVEELMASAAEVRVAFVQQVVAAFAKLGARNGKPPAGAWWYKNSELPAASEHVAEKVLRKQLPFTDETLTIMFEQIADMDYMTFAPVLEQLVRVLEKRAIKEPLSPRICKALGRVVDGLLVKEWSERERRDNGFPRAIDRKIAGRIEGLLNGPLDLGDGTGKKKS